MKRLSRTALDGFIGNLVWALLLIVVIAIAPFLEGSVPAWLFTVVLVPALGLSAFIGSAATRRAERMRGARDEARRHESEAMERASEAAEKLGAENRELREQLVAASGGQQAVSTRMQSIARQVEALASGPTGGPYGPSDGQVKLLIALLEDLEQKFPDNDPVVAGLLVSWRDSDDDQGDADWVSTLHVLKARAVSLGAEEALG